MKLDKLKEFYLKNLDKLNKTSINKLANLKKTIKKLLKIYTILVVKFLLISNHHMVEVVVSLVGFCLIIQCQIIIRFFVWQSYYITFFSFCKYIFLFSLPFCAKILYICKSLLIINKFRSYTPYELRLYASLDAWCFAPCCVTHNARGAIFLGLLASELADSLYVDYPAQVTTRRFK